MHSRKLQHKIHVKKTLLRHAIELSRDDRLKIKVSLCKVCDVHRTYPGYQLGLCLHKGYQHTVVMIRSKSLFS